MPAEKIVIIQQVRMRLPVLACILGLLGGCADALDQTNGDLDSSAGSMTYIAGQMHTEGDDEGAMEFYARAIQRSPSDITARAKLAELFEAHGGYKDAAEQYRALVKLVPDNADYWRGYGRVLVKQNHPADAKGKYEAALKIDDSDIRTLNGLGVTLDLLGDHVGAQEKYEAALGQKSDDLVTLNNLGHSYVLAGAYDDAIKLLEPQLDNAAAPAALRGNLAEAYAKAGMDADAERVLGMDMPPDQVKKKVAHYRALRAKTSAPPLYAMLGSFTTSGFAQARLDNIRQQFAKESEPLTLEVVPQTDEEGGTPVFYTRARGFKDAGAARTFCEALKHGGAFCKVQEGEKPSSDPRPPSDD
jgi:Flp pilus assembly protein TadD